jgi:hypothetical protein
MQATEYSGSPVNIIQSLRSQMEVRPSKPLNIVEAREYRQVVKVPDESPSIQATEYCGSPVNIVKKLRFGMEALASNPLILCYICGSPVNIVKRLASWMEALQPTEYCGS